MVSSFDHASGERLTSLLAARLNRDDHANPSIQVRPDGRLVVFYSRHVGPAMHYRISTAPERRELVGARRRRCPATRTASVRLTPIRTRSSLEAEARTYLFWRGGNYNPTFSTQDDGSTTWSPARNLILMPASGPTRNTPRAAGTRSTWPTRTLTRTSTRTSTSTTRASAPADRTRVRGRRAPLGGAPIAPARRRSGLRRDGARLGSRRRGRLGRPAGDRVRELPVGERPSLPLRALDRQRLGASTRSPRGRLLPRGRRLALLLGRAHARSRGSLACLPVPEGRHRLWQVEAWTTPDGGRGWTSHARSASRRPRRTSGRCRRGACRRSAAI